MFTSTICHNKILNFADKETLRRCDFLNKEQLYEWDRRQTKVRQWDSETWDRMSGSLTPRRSTLALQGERKSISNDIKFKILY